MIFKSITSIYICMSKIINSFVIHSYIYIDEEIIFKIELVICFPGTYWLTTFSSLNLFFLSFLWINFFETSGKLSLSSSSFPIYSFCINEREAYNETDNVKFSNYKSCRKIFSSLVSLLLNAQWQHNKERGQAEVLRWWLRKV